ncbi:anhydro-N-acetylmuramic acid kinase [Bacteroidota bacterium]|nr:anhydro-N-acetylmuramic acid kinase [Bacteroidota bacterium]|tara:strand:+ start:1934 stop:2995 length:1062 start_codon:yes stop_codon:yes gene_type:complete
MNKYSVIGVMSGTSLDGIDIVYCQLLLNKKWNYNIIKSQTYQYTKVWKQKLINAHLLKARDFVFLDHEFGKYIGEKTNQFIVENNLLKEEIDLISSHGHTIFHEPQNGFTFQLGNGTQICAITKLKTISDFRTLNVAFGGHGAPLVPKGDQLLFDQYKACLNLGGIANISFNNHESLTAGDINFANMISNYLSEKLGFSLDEDGHLAAQGSYNENLMSKLKNLDFYQKDFPKSLSIEDFNIWYKPIFDNCNCSIYDQLFTSGIHLCETIKNSLNMDEKDEILITGGGSYNNFWIKKLKEFKVNVVIPNSILIDFKEALIFALLGVLKMRNEENSLSSVTGSSKNLKTGTIYDS